MSSGLGSTLQSWLNDLFAPLLAAAQDQDALRALLDLLGHTDVVSQNAAFRQAISEAGTLAGQISTLDPANLDSWSGIQQLLNIAQTASEALRTLRQLANDPALSQIAGGLAEELTAVLLANYLRRGHETAFRVASFLTLIRTREFAPVGPAIFDGAVAARHGRSLDEFQFDAFSALLSDPWKTLETEYLPNGMATGDDAWLAAGRLFPQLGLLANTLDLSWRTGSRVAESATSATETERYYPTFSFLLFHDDAGTFSIDVLSSSLRHPGAAAGYVISLAGSGQQTATQGQWKLTISVNGQVPALVAGPGGFVPAPTNVPLTSAEAKLLMERVPTAGTSGPAFLFGSAQGTRLELGTAQLTFDLSCSAPNHAAASIAFAATSCELVVAPGDGDGFLSSVLPADGLRASFNIGLTLSDRGFSVTGGAGLDATLPVGISIGGVVTIPTVHLALKADDTGLVAEVSIGIGVLIGPVQAVADRVGIVSNITFPQDGGNLGVADLTFAFKPPSGVGLAIDAAGVSGGGFLGHDDTKHEYTGVLQLQFTDLALQAFALITTQVAGGDGYSLLAMIDADFPPVQLGWGFTLDGVGGLMAVHRSASVDALRAALKADKLSTIMFPKNAITNAPQILAQLDTFFPTAPGRFLFGPMALIGWGTPTLLTAAIAVIIELPEPIRIILLARLAARLPSESNTLVRINMDALGVLDLGQSSLALDSTLFDSRLLSFALSGDMALRANWAGEPREFLLSVGGFHPRFTPPSGFPTLKRLSIDMKSGSVATLHLDTYLAITSNTLQIGANLHALIKVSAFSVDGHLGFDALFQRNPFHFDGDISGSVAISIDGDDLLSVSLDATLTGPAPWHISGNFKVHIIFVDVHKSFSSTWGDDLLAELIAAVDVGALLAIELADPRSWGAQLADGIPALVSARNVQNAGVVVAHPLARLEVHERTAPLGLDISRLGGAPLSGANHFAITDFRIGGSAISGESVQDDFAAAEFFDLSEDEKLARPSFERHDAGVRLSGGLVSSGSPVNKEITYETFFIDETGGEPRTDPGTPVQKWFLTDLQAVLSSGSAALATMMRAGNRRYTAPGNPIRVAEPAFVLVDADTLAPVGIGPTKGAAYSDVRALLNQELNRVPAQQGHLQIVATHEMVAPNA